MRLSFRTTAAALSLATLLILASCGRRERVIPRDELAEIYADMFVLDQWLNDNGSLRRSADTSMVYAPVLEKYGYDYDDYLNSLGYYMKDPARYSKILRTTSEILNRRLSDLKARRRVEEEELIRRRHLDSLKAFVAINADSLFAAMLPAEPSDSIVFERDSLRFFKVRFISVSDTVYDGPELIVRIDSTALHPADSVAVQTADSTAVQSAERSVRRPVEKPVMHPADGPLSRKKDYGEAADGLKPMEDGRVATPDSLKLKKNASLRHNSLRPGAQPAFRRFSGD